MDTIVIARTSLAATNNSLYLKVRWTYLRTHTMIVDLRAEFKANTQWRTTCSSTRREREVCNSLETFRIKIEGLLFRILQPNTNKCQQLSRTTFIPISIRALTDNELFLSSSSRSSCRTTCSSCQSYRPNRQCSISPWATILLIKRNINLCRWINSTTIKLKRQQMMLFFRNISLNNTVKVWN